MVHDDKFLVVLNNLRDDQGVYVNLPDLPGLPEGVLVEEGEYFRYTSTLSSPPSIPVPWPITRVGDANWDGSIDMADYYLVIGSYGFCNTAECDPCYSDLNGSGAVNIDDLWIVISNFGWRCWIEVCRDDSTPTSRRCRPCIVRPQLLRTNPVTRSCDGV